MRPRGPLPPPGAKRPRRVASERLGEGSRGASLLTACTALTALAHRPATKFRYAGTLLALATLLAACGGSAAPAASQPASATGSAAAKPSPAAPAGAASAPASPSAKPAAGGSAGTAAPVPSGVTPINVAFAASAAVYDPWYIAMEKGYDVEEGIKIQMTQAGGGVSTPALISNKLDYSTSAASAFSAVLKGAPLKIIFTNADKPQYRLYSTSKDIKTLADLKGKS